MARGKQSIAELIGKIYEAALDDDQWLALLEQFQARFGAMDASVAMIDLAANRFAFIRTFNVDPSHLKSYEDHYLSIHAYRRSMETHVGEYVSHALLPEKELVGTEFYNDWQKPQDIHYICGLTSKDEKSSLGLLSMNRPKSAGPFDGSDLRVLRAIKPHFDKAIRLNCRLWQMKGQWDAAQDLMNRLDVGVIFIDEHEHAVHWNAEAEALLRADSPLRIKAGRLVTRDAGTTETLRREIHAAVETAKATAIQEIPHQLVPLRDAAGLLTAEIAPLRVPRYTALAHGTRVCAVVLLARIDAPRVVSARVLEQFFGLTPAEARLAVSLSKGCSLEECAEDSGIRISTVRNQLKSVFLKTDTHRQSEIVRLVLSVRTKLRGLPREASPAGAS